MLRFAIAPVSILAALSLVACGNSDTSKPPVSPEPAAVPVAPVATEVADAGAAPAPATKAETGKATPVTVWKGIGLSTPESVLYDDQADLYIVSNIDGSPLAADGKGFISRISPDGKVENLKWIESGKNKVVLNAPKGLALSGDRLFVADLDTVRMFDRKTGAPLGDVKIAGATFVNDVTPGENGHVFATDSGLKGGPKGFEPSGTDAVYDIDPKAKKATAVAKSKDLGAPNGILHAGKDTWVVTFGSGELYSLDEKGKKTQVQKLPKGMLDGIVALPNGDLLVSSWDATGIYRGKPGGDFKLIVEGIKAPTDIGYDSKRNLVLVPTFGENEVQAYEVR